MNNSLGSSFGAENWTVGNEKDQKLAPSVAPEDIPGPSNATDVKSDRHLAEVTETLKNAGNVLDEKDSEIKALRSRILTIEASEKHLIRENDKLKESEYNKEVTIRLANKRFEKMKEVKAQIPWKNAAGAILNNFKAAFQISEALVLDLGTELGRQKEFAELIEGTDDNFLTLKNNRKMKISHLNEWAGDERRGDRIVKYDWDDQFAWFKIKSKGDGDEDSFPLKVKTSDEAFTDLFPKEEVPILNIDEDANLVDITTDQKVAPNEKSGEIGE